MRWEKALLIVSIVVFLLAVIYSAVTLLRLPPATEVVSETASLPRVAKTQVLTVPDTTAAPDLDAEDRQITRGADVLSDGEKVSSQSGSEELASDLVSEDDIFVTDTAGEYPEVPPGYPFKPFWELPEEIQVDTPLDQREQHVLLDKVLIELWKRGDRNFVSGIFPQSLGKVYPLYPNTIYVHWEEVIGETGTTKKYVSRAFGADDMKLPPLASEEDIPYGVRVIDLDSEEGQGIDPYEFLAK